MSYLNCLKILLYILTSGDREFAGFWNFAEADKFADYYYTPKCQIESMFNEKTAAVVVGTLGLAYDPMKTTMNAVKKVLLQKYGSCSDTTRPLLVVDINWRSVFWPKNNDNDAKRIIGEYVQGADLIKLTDEEAKWLLGIDSSDALMHPEKVDFKLVGAG